MRVFRLIFDGKYRIQERKGRFFKKWVEYYHKEESNDGLGHVVKVQWKEDDKREAKKKENTEWGKFLKGREKIDAEKTTKEWAEDDKREDKAKKIKYDDDKTDAQVDIKKALGRKKKKAIKKPKKKRAIAVVKILYHVSLNKMAKYFNENGFLTSTGKQFNPTAVSNLRKLYGH